MHSPKTSMLRPIRAKVLVLVAVAAIRTAFAGPAAAPTVEQERDRDGKAYAAAIGGLKRDHSNEWVVIADGKVAATGPRVADVLGTGAKALHRYVFQVGEDGDASEMITMWYGPRFCGAGLPMALGFEFALGGGWRRPADGATFEQMKDETPFPRNGVQVGPPGGRSELLDVLIGTVGPPLMLTPDDFERLGLARFEVPGTLTVFGMPCRRAVVRVALPGFDAEATIVACAPSVPRKQLVESSRWRDIGWFEDRFGVWAMDPWASNRKALEGRWALIGVDRLLGDGDSPEAALLAGEGKASEAYHRFLTRMPRAEERVYDESKFSKPSKVTLNGLELSLRRATIDGAEEFLADEATAQRLHLELAEEARCAFVLRDGKRIDAHVGAAWLGKRPTAAEHGGAKIAWVVYALPSGEKVGYCEPPPALPDLPAPTK